jgi:UDP-N-acetylglucosamine 2-epimerase (non-hydrolysing)
MPYTHNSKENLLNEGIPGERIHVIGNPILEVLNHYSPQINNSKILEHLKLRPKKYMLMTLHRAENVDIDERLDKFVEALNQIYSKYRLPIIWSIHPRTHDKLQKNRIKLTKGIIAHESFGLFDFIKLEKNTGVVLTDSGTVQEECCIFKVPNVTVRDVTERPETLDVGSNILSGMQPESILKCVDIVISRSCNWEPPIEYLKKDVSDTIVKIVSGYLHT